VTGQRSVDAVWEGGLRCTVRAGRFQLTVDEPEWAGGTDAGPQPTDLLLATVASCFTLALAHSAAKRGVPLGILEVRATGTYDGPGFAEIVITVRCDPPPADLDQLIAAAERVCYVSNTLRRCPSLLVRTG
jgi:organic hydroperoxide reductase OsmC/OhrA